MPVALISLVEADRQVFPGAYGLTDPWQQRRQTPLSHSFCQHVVIAAAPLVIEDARSDPRVAGNLAVPELEVVAYAGMPLTADDGAVLGTLCAIDTAPRRWTPDELALLEDLAAACSDTLRLRIAHSDALHQAGDAQARWVQTDAAFDRSQLLLHASVALAETSTAPDVIDALRDLVTGTLDPAYIGLSLHDGYGRMDLRSSQTLPPQVADRWDRYPDTAATPSALAVRTGAPVLLPDLTAVQAVTPDAVDTFTQMGWQSAASVPLPSPTGPVGALTFVWEQPNALGEAEQAVLAALAGYVAQALQRAEFLAARQTVAAVLQRALLSAVPDVAPFEVAAQFEPAVRSEQVGGDWYDVIRIDAERLAITIGDVSGHDIGAAALMGKLRSKLRLLIADRQETPSALLARLDAANHTLGDTIMATALLAVVEPDPAGGHILHWSNAGHPRPLLATGTTVTILTGHDLLLGVDPTRPRSDHTHPLPPGSTLLLYTDGLIESRGQHYLDREQQLLHTFAGLATTPLPDLLQTLYTTFAGPDHEDDVALLAVRTP
ncbi:GAF domain-containing SpoIIE family protein phosphatase [Dactylosporangium sp. CS-047395]|uniref:GAF domain-containing SpoIIE family protein phosphatase n=1 Tax=Dactylosporangium sp. CS-047395 TaxID=3239936 RepID=UPI003D922230